MADERLSEFESIAQDFSEQIDRVVLRLNEPHEISLIFREQRTADARRRCYFCVQDTRTGNIACVPVR
jgi:hypothetical protein